MAPGTCAFGTMAKAPRPGFSKTRLCPPLTHAQAARLSAAFLRDMTGNLAAASKLAPIEAYVAYAPEEARDLIDQNVPDGTKLLLADGKPEMPRGVEGFGRSLLHAIQGMLSRGHYAAVVLNSDSPTLPTAFLLDAACALREADDTVVLGPADDGGYYLLGMRQAHAHMFRDIAWSTASVAEATRQRARDLGLRIVELPNWYDVDDQQALNRLLQETSEDTRGQAEVTPYPAPATAKALTQIGLRYAHLAAG